MMSRHFSDAQNYYQRMKELQEKLKQSEDERSKLEKRFNKILQTCRAEDRIRKLSSAKDNYFQLLEEDRLRSDRNDSLMQILDRIENRACSINAKTERLRLLRKHYEAYMERTYPGWKANESKFYESYNEKLKAINSHFRTLSHDYRDIPNWKTNSDIDISRDDYSNTAAISPAYYPQTTYSPNSSSHLPEQNRTRNNVRNSDSQTDIYNNYAYQPSRETSMNEPAMNNYSQDTTPLGTSMGLKTSSYMSNNLANNLKSKYNSNVSNASSMLSEFELDSSRWNNDVDLSLSRQADVDLDKDFNTKSDYFLNDPFDKTVNNSLLNSPKFSRYDSSRQSFKYNYNPITPTGKYSSHYSRPISNVKSYIPKSLTRSASLDTFTSKYSHKYRLQSPTRPVSAYYGGEQLFRSNSLGRIPQERKLSFSSTNLADNRDFSSSYKKYTPWTKTPERKNYSSSASIYTNNKSPSTGYYSYRSTSPANSSRYSSYNAVGPSYSRYASPGLTRSNSIQKYYDPYTIAPKRSIVSNLPYTSSLSRSQSFSDIDDLDYLSRKKNYDMSGWNQYPMGRERFYYDNKHSNNYLSSPTTNQYRPSYSPEPLYNTKRYSFQADKSTSTDDGYNEDKSFHGKKMARVHYASDTNMDSDIPHYNDYSTDGSIDRTIYDKNSYIQQHQRPATYANGYERRGTIIAPEIAGTVMPHKNTSVDLSHDIKGLSAKDEPGVKSFVEQRKPDESNLVEFKAQTPLPYSQQVLQTLEERTEEDITQSTSENPSLGSEQHWENEIGKLKDIMNYDPHTTYPTIDDRDQNKMLPADFPPGTLKAEVQKSPEGSQSYYHQSQNDSKAINDSLPKTVTGYNEELSKNGASSGSTELPDLKQEIEMLKKKQSSRANEENSSPGKREIVPANTTNDYPSEAGGNGRKQHTVSSTNAMYDEFQGRNGRNNEQKSQPVRDEKHPENLDYNNYGNYEKSPERIEPQMMEKQDNQQEKNEKGYDKTGETQKELNRSPKSLQPQQMISPLQSEAGRTNNFKRIDDQQQMPKKQENDIYSNIKQDENLRHHEPDFSRNLQSTDLKEPSRIQLHTDPQIAHDNEPIKSNNEIQPSNQIDSQIHQDIPQEQTYSGRFDTPTEKSHDYKVAEESINHPLPMDRTSPKMESMRIKPNTNGVSNQSQQDGQQFRSDTEKRVDQTVVDQHPINNGNAFSKQKTDMQYDGYVQPNSQAQLENDNRQRTGENYGGDLKQQDPQSIPQNYQQQQLQKSGVPSVQPQIYQKGSTDEAREQNYQTKQPQQQLGDQESQQQAMSQGEQNYSEQPQYQNYEGETPYDQYSYPESKGDGYQQPYDNSSSYQYAEDPVAQQYQGEQPQQYQEEQYPQQQGGKYPLQQEGSYPPQQEGQYPPPQEGQYPPPQEGQYPPLQEGQYPPQQEGQYPPQQEGQYPPLQEGQYPPQQEGQYPPQQEGKYPPSQEGQYPPQQEGQYPQQQEKPYPPQLEEQYPEGREPDQYPNNQIEQQYTQDPQQYSEELPQQYIPEQNQQLYQNDQYHQQYDGGQMAHNYPDEQYNNYQQNNAAYPDNYFEQPNYQDYPEQKPEHYQQGPDQYATQPEEQLYNEGQVASKPDEYRPPEQGLPNTENYDEQQSESQNIPAPVQQSQDHGFSDALQEQRGVESAKLKDENQKEVKREEPEKVQPAESSVGEVAKKPSAKDSNSPKHDENISKVPEQTTPGDKSTSGAAKSATNSKGNEKVAEGKPEVGASKPVTPSRGERTSDSSGASGKGSVRTGDKKSEGGGKGSTVSSKGADNKRGDSKTKVGDKAGGLKGTAPKTGLSKTQK